MRSVIRSDDAVAVAVGELQPDANDAMATKILGYVNDDRTVAEIVLQLEGVLPQLEAVAQDWSSTTDRGQEFVLRIIAAKYNAVEAAFRVVDKALDLSEIPLDTVAHALQVVTVVVQIGVQFGEVEQDVDVAMALLEEKVALISDASQESQP